jgi:drug/metabolite transporter (DMT)-like permease
MKSATRGMLVAFVGVAIFSATLPMTRIAIRELDPVWVALARVQIAALAAVFALRWYRVPWPGFAQLSALLITALGVVLGFPLLSSLAMKTSNASQGAVIVGLLPIATAVFATLRAGERPSRAFWLAAGAGTLIVIVFAWTRGSTNGFSVGDLFMLGAVVLGALGYAEGGKLSRLLGGWQTIALALVVSAPLMLLPTIWLTPASLVNVGWQSWGALLYLALFSQFLGFLFWYGGMSIGGVARASQVQLLQVFMTLLLSMLLLNESVTAITWFVAVAVLAAVVATRNAPIQPSPALPASAPAK